MNPILQAINSGYSEDDVIKFISKAIPKLYPTINKALGAGYGVKEVLGYLAKVTSPRDIRGMSQVDIHNENKRQNEALTKKGLGILATGAAANISSFAANKALSHALPQALAPQSLPAASPSYNPVSIGNQQTPTTQGTQNPLTQKQALNNPTIAQQPPTDLGNANNNVTQDNIKQTEEKTNIADVLWNDLEKSSGKKFGFESDAFLKIARRMKSTGEIRSKEDFQRLFNIFEKKKSEGKNLPEALREASNEYDVEKLATVSKDEDKLGFKAAFNTLKGGAVSEKFYEGIFKSLQDGKDTFAGVKDNLLIAAKPAYDAGQIKSVDDLKKFADYWNKSKNKIEKSSIVASPQGLGQVKEIRNGQALIDVDGKIHNVKEEELTRSPLPEKELADLYEDLIKGIESETEEDVSRMVQWAGYDPESNTLQFLPHDGDLYTYTNIPQEKADLLRDILSVRKTSGSNFIGAWKAGSKSPIGAAMSKLIRELQSERGGKGNEYEAKYPTVYNAYSPAIKARKEKEKDEKRKKRERLKNRS